MKIEFFNKIVCMLALISILAACEKEEAITGITVDKESLSLILGENAQITVNPVPADAGIDTRTYEWSSDNEAIAIVTPFGIVRSIEEGSCNITVKQGTFSKVIPVTVVDPIQVPAKKAHWKFEDADIRTATIGQALVYGKRIDGSPRTTELPTTDLSGFTPIAGPKSDNKAVHVSQWYFFQAAHGIPAGNGGGTKVNEYTIMFDFRIPQTGWHCFLQTAPNNNDDGDLFTNGSGKVGVGSTGYSADAVPAGEWHRLVASVKSGEFINYYLDGTLIHTLSAGGKSIEDFPIDGHRFVLEDKIVLIGDEDGEDGDMDVSEIALWEQALDANQVKKLERTES
ncbi:MAG: Ig-like domain-containing protein, partial [Dysgonamonadaceae bacterium]|nr:Ig-like domain-containing protein [Dysgonamonadaceae bacterium]